MLKCGTIGTVRHGRHVDKSHTSSPTPLPACATRHPHSARMRAFPRLSAEDRLLAAAEDGDFAGVCEALKKGADPQCSTPSLWTPLHYAAAKGREDIARVLLNAGASPEVETDVGRRPLHWAARNGYSEVARCLLNAGADMDAASSPDDGGCTPLHLAAQLGKVSTVRLLLECGASVLRCHTGGSTPLHYAAGGGHVHVAALLLAKGGPELVNLQDEQGATALHKAAAAAELGTVRLLVEHGASKTLKTMSGRTAADCAKDAATLQILTDAQARDHPDGEQLTSSGAPDGNAPARVHAAPVVQQAAAPAAAASLSTTPAAALPPDLTSWLDALGLGAYAEPLGLSCLDDVQLLEEGDLREVGMKPVERKRWLAAKQSLSAPAT